MVRKYHETSSRKLPLSRDAEDRLGEDTRKPAVQVTPAAAPEEAAAPAALIDSTELYANSLTIYAALGGAVSRRLVETRLQRLGSNIEAAIADDTPAGSLPTPVWVQRLGQPEPAPVQPEAPDWPRDAKGIPLDPFQGAEVYGIGA